MGRDETSKGVALDLGAWVREQGTSAVLVASLRPPVDAALVDGWKLGPLPIIQAVNASTQAQELRHATDEEARRGLVAAHQSDALYGGGRLTRTHKLLVQPLSVDGLSVLAVELLFGTPLAKLPEDRLAYLAVHVAPDSGAGDVLDAHLEALTKVIRRGTLPKDDVWAAVAAHLPEGFELIERSRVRALHFAVIPPHLADQDSALQEAYALASAARPEQRLDLAERSSRHSFTISKADWSCLVMRDGSAFIAHQTSAEPFSEVLRVLVHSVHLDALLLALVQRQMVDASGGRAVTAPLDDPDPLVALETAHFDFKRTYWRTSLTEKRTAPSDELLRALQDELLTARDVADVEDRVHDGARLASSLQAKRLDNAQSRLNRMVQNATVIIGAFGLAFTAAPVLEQPSWTLFVLASAAGLTGMLIAFVVLHLTGRRAGVAKSSIRAGEDSR